MKSINQNELKSIQLDILKHIDSFCKENNIRYFLIGGSAIGAVRHHGFIPWDDDIDITMLREDYDRFVSIYPNVDKSCYKLHCTYNQEDFPYPYAKIDNSGTVFIEEVEDEFSMGVNIDLFPMEVIPDAPELQEKLFKRAEFLKKIFTAKRLPMKRRRGIVKNMTLLLAHIFLSVISFKTIVKAMEKNATKYRGLKTNYRAGVAWGYGNKEINKSDNWSETVYLKFEDMSAPLPKGYHEVLTGIYGDYMQLPPEDKRVSHHHFTAYWK